MLLGHLSDKSVSSGRERNRIRQAGGQLPQAQIKGSPNPQPLLPWREQADRVQPLVLQDTLLEAAQLDKGARRGRCRPREVLEKGWGRGKGPPQSALSHLRRPTRHHFRTPTHPEPLACSLDQPAKGRQSSLPSVLPAIQNQQGRGPSPDRPHGRALPATRCPEQRRGPATDARQGPSSLLSLGGGVWSPCGERPPHPAGPVCSESGGWGS